MTTSKEVAAISETAFSVLERHQVAEDKLHRVVAELTSEIHLALALIKYDTFTND